MASSHYFERVYDVVLQIPPGRVTSYGAIADYLSLGSARMVGWALKNSSKMGADVPAHRVVNRLGELSGRLQFSTPTEMADLLALEGVSVVDNKVENFELIFWHPGHHLFS